MRKKFNIFLLLFVLPLMAVDCLNSRKVYIPVLNKSQNKLYAYCDAVFTTSDTAINESKQGGLLKVVFPNNYTNVYVGPTSWDVVFEYKNTIRVFIFHADTVDKYPWEVIRKEYKILKRYDLTKKDVEITGGVLTYP